MYIENPERIVETMVSHGASNHVVHVNDNGPENAENNRILLSSLRTDYLMSPA